MIDCLQQLGEIKYESVTLNQQVVIVTNLLNNAESKHFETICHIAWQDTAQARDQKQAEAKKYEVAIEQLRKQLAALNARKPNEKEP